MRIFYNAKLDHQVSDQIRQMRQILKSPGQRSEAERQLGRNIMVLGFTTPAANPVKLQI